MRKLLFAVLVSLASGAFAATYKSADFGGGLNSVGSGFQSRLTAAGYNASLFNCSTCANATAVSGHLIYDASMMFSNSGFVNSFSIAPIANVPDSQVFSFDIDGLHFQLGDAGTQGGPAIQYHNGVYNGIFFAEDFLSPNGTSLELNMQGSTFSLMRLSDFQLLLTGFLNTGANGLTNVADFSPAAAVPEPEIYATLMMGLGMLGWQARRRRRTSA
jgi:hypothetical protein